MFCSAFRGLSAAVERPSFKATYIDESRKSMSSMHVTMIEVKMLIASTKSTKFERTDRLWGQA